MNSNEKIEARLKKEIEEVTPDVFSKVLEKVKLQNDTPVISFDSYKKKKSPIKRLLSVAAAFDVIVASVFAFMNGFNQNTFNVEFDVNPGIILEINDKNKVTDVVTLNDDAVYVLDSMDLKGSNLDVAVNAIMYSIIKNGYIDEMTNSVLVSVGNTTHSKQEEISESITNQINSTFSDNALEGSVLVQSIETLPEIEELSSKYGITAGKASLIKHLVDSEKTTYSYESLAKLSINELNLILTAKNATENVTVFGHASTKAYIGDKVAKDIAYKAAGIDPLSVKHCTCEIDLEDGVIIYDVEFIVPGAIYDCEIDATSGELIDFEIDTVDDLYSEETSSVIDSNPTVVFKSKEDVKELLLKKNGLTSAMCQHFTISLNYEDSFAKYDVEFISGNQKYEYEVNAVDASIISFSHKEIKEDNSQKVTEPFTTSPENVTSSADLTENTDDTSSANETKLRISKEDAINIALKHAGVQNATDIDFETEFGFNNGIVYCIEFKYANMEYEYEIDASSGEIVDFEKDIDD